MLCNNNTRNHLERLCLGISQCLSMIRLLTSRSFILFLVICVSWLRVSCSLKTWYTITSEFKVDAAFGYSADSIGDFNGDSIPDYIISAPQANALNRTKSGCVYLLYGVNSSNAIGDLDLAALTPFQGFRIIGSTGSLLGSGSKGIGDWNGDGFADIIVTAPGKSKQGRTNGGMAYIILGKLGGYEFIDLAKHKAPTYGLKIYGSSRGAMLGAGSHGVDGLGDFNEDGFDDVVIGEHGKNDYTGEVHVLFGSSTAADIDLAAPLAGKGFVVRGNEPNSMCGDKVHGAGGFRWGSAVGNGGKGYKQRGDVLMACGSKVIYLYGGKDKTKDRHLSEIMYFDEGVYVFGTLPSAAMTATYPSATATPYLLLADEALGAVYVVKSGGKVEAGEDGVDVRRLHKRGSVILGPEGYPNAMSLLPSNPPALFLHSPNCNQYYGVTYVLTDQQAGARWFEHGVDMKEVNHSDEAALKERGLSAIIAPPNVGGGRTHLLPLGVSVGQGGEDVLLTNTFFVDGVVDEEEDSQGGWISDLGALARGRGRAFILLGGFQHRTRIDLGNEYHNIDLHDDVSDVHEFKSIPEKGVELPRAEL